MLNINHNSVVVEVTQKNNGSFSEATIHLLLATINAAICLLSIAYLFLRMYKSPLQDFTISSAPPPLIFPVTQASLLIL